MAFTHEISEPSSASTEAVWAIWADPTTWPTWDPPVDAVDVALEEGATGTITLAGGITAPVTIDVVEPGRRFLDRLTMGELVITIDHVVDAEGDGCRVTVSTVIEGPGADDIGPMVTAEAPVAMAALRELAENG